MVTRERIQERDGKAIRTTTENGKIVEVAEIDPLTGKVISTSKDLTRREREEAKRKQTFKTLEVTETERGRKEVRTEFKTPEKKEPISRETTLIQKQIVGEQPTVQELAPDPQREIQRQVIREQKKRKVEELERPKGEIRAAPKPSTFEEVKGRVETAIASFLTRGEETTFEGLGLRLKKGEGFFKETELFKKVQQDFESAKERQKESLQEFVSSFESVKERFSPDKTKQDQDTKTDQKGDIQFKQDKDSILFKTLQSEIDIGKATQEVAPKLGKVIKTSVEAGVSELGAGALESPVTTSALLLGGAKVLSTAAKVAPKLTKTGIAAFEVSQIIIQPSPEAKLRTAAQFAVFDVGIAGAEKGITKIRKTTGKTFIEPEAKKLLEQLAKEKPGEIKIKEFPGIEKEKQVIRSDVDIDIEQFKGTKKEEFPSQKIVRELPTEESVLTFESDGRTKIRGVITPEGTQFQTLQTKFKGKDFIITAETKPTGERKIKILKDEKIIGRIEDVAERDILFTEPLEVLKGKTVIEKPEFRAEIIKRELEQEIVSLVEPKLFKKTFKPKGKGKIIERETIASKIVEPQREIIKSKDIFITEEGKIRQDIIIRDIPSKIKFVDFPVEPKKAFALETEKELIKRTPPKILTEQKLEREAEFIIGFEEQPAKAKKGFKKFLEEEKGALTLIPEQELEIQKPTLEVTPEIKTKKISILTAEDIVAGKLENVLLLDTKQKEDLIKLPELLTPKDPTVPSKGNAKNIRTGTNKNNKKNKYIEEL